MENNFLSHFINETVYVIEEDTSLQKTDTSNEDHSTPSAEKDTSLKEDVPSYPAKETQKTPSLKFKGSNISKTLIVVDYSDHEHINNEDEMFLAKILKAVNLSIEEAAILNLNSNSHFDYDHLLNFDAAHVLYFGENKILPSEFSNYSLQLVESKQILLSPDLSKTSVDTEKKKQLWGALKKMF